VRVVRGQVGERDGHRSCSRAPGAWSVCSLLWCMGPAQLDFTVGSLLTTDLRGSPISPCRGPIQIFVGRGPIQIAENSRKSPIIAENPSFRPTSEGHSYYHRL
jgi:hypothetical protein